MLEPVQFTIERRCAFAARELVCRGCAATRPKSHARAVPRSKPKQWPPCGACGATEKPIQRQGCATCGQPKGHADHWHLESFNAMAGRDPEVYRNAIQRTAEVMRAPLEACDLPRPVGRVVAEAHAIFPTRAKRDQGNFRVIPEKALGDVLKALGILVDDDWDRYEFGNLTRGYAQPHEAGRHALVVTLFPTADVTAEGAELTLAI